MKKRFFLWLCLTFGLAIQLSSQQIDMDAVFAEENIRWGVYAFHRSYYNEAIRAFETALGFKPKSAKIHFWLGKALYKSGYEQAALSEWQNNLSSGTADPLLQNMVQVINLRRGIGRDIAEEERLVVTRVYDAGNNTYHPFKRPTSVKPARDGSVWVVAYGSNEVLRISANGVVVDYFKGGLTLAPYDHPFDILPNSDGSFFLSEYEGNRISLCKPNGDREKSFGKKGTGDNELLGPQFLARDSKGYLYVTDWGNKRVCKFDPEGTFILSFGAPVKGKLATNPAFLAGPTGIAVLDGQVLVADKKQQRIAVFDQSGNYLRSYGDGAFWGPEGLYLKDRQTLFVADTDWLNGKTRILKFNPEQEKITPLDGLPGDLSKIMNTAVDDNGNLVAVDYNLNRIVFMSGISDLYSGYYVEIQRIESVNFPEITIDLAVEDRYGRPVSGLEARNFLVAEPEQVITGLTIYNPVAQQQNISVMLLVEKSPAMAAEKAVLSKATADLLKGFSNTALTVVSAGEVPAIVLDKPAGTTELLATVSGGKYSAAWQLAPAIRLAGTALLASRNRRAIVYLSTGSTGQQAFADYPLMELSRFLKNNYISFNLVHLSAGEPAEELLFLCEATGGDVYGYFSPAGVLPLMEKLREKPDPRYVLRYQSHTFPDFGKKYIEVSIEVILNKISGKDRLGYYAPLE